MPSLAALPSVGDYAPPHPLAQVPSLAWICLSILYHHPDQIHQIPYRLNYRPELNIIDDVLAMDPRMWAALVQLYDNLPDYMRTFAIPLRDSHMPKLQSIPCTARFSMVTVLEAPACRNLCDDNIANLKELNSLAALDASGTHLTSHGIKALAFTMHDDVGPWGLRVLDLRECLGITTDVYAHLSKFPLLTVVGKSRNHDFLPFTNQPSNAQTFVAPNAVTEFLHLQASQSEDILCFSTPPNCPISWHACRKPTQACIPLQTHLHCSSIPSTIRGGRLLKASSAMTIPSSPSSTMTFIWIMATPSLGALKREKSVSDMRRTRLSGIDDGNFWS